MSRFRWRRPPKRLKNACFRLFLRSSTRSAAVLADFSRYFEMWPLWAIGWYAYLCSMAVAILGP